MKRNEKWQKFLKNGDISSYIEYKKQQKKDIEISDGYNYGVKRRDSNKK